MSPFRELPPAELGPLDVGLEGAARVARLRIPRGGRLIAGRGGLVSLHAAGALGSAGILAVSSVALIGWLLKWAPHTAADVLLCVGGVIAGGMSLAAILRALDRRDGLATENGAVVGRAARRVVRRLERLATDARTSPDGFGARRIGALRRALHAARSPEILRWVPSDLRGRAALLLARAIAAHAGTRWARDVARRAEISALLGQAMDDLSDPRPAAGDLAVLKRRAPEPTPCLRVPLAISTPADAEVRDTDEEDAQVAASLGRLRAR